MLRTFRARIGFGVLTAVTILVASAVMPALAEDMTAMPGMKPSHGAPATSPADRAFATSMETMMKTMAVKPTGNPDRDFVDMMMPHHVGAVDMAKVELKFGKDPMLLKLAADIVKAQESEIAEMRAWRARHP